MSRLSKKLQREISLASVFSEVLDDHFRSSLNGCFTDDHPEMWSEDHKQIFDIASEVEHRLKEIILQLLGVQAR